MIERTATSRPRCVLVLLAGTAVAWGATAALVQQLVGALRAAPADSGAGAALVALCLAGLVLAALLGWAQGVAAVVEAWRGRPAATRPRGVRRVVLALCGVGLAASLLGGPALAVPAHPHPDPVVGLPMPDRATDGAAAPPPARSVVVRPGDSLWSLARDRLGPHATDADVAVAWRHLYRANRAAIGADPDLIRPGERLALPSYDTYSEEKP
jgi:nucleoid-associated protein YgaU